MPIQDQQAWDEWEKSNQDNYGKCILNVARRVMELIDKYPKKPLQATYRGKMSVHRLICDADKQMNAGGITGFMAGCVAQIVSKCHSRGKEFQAAWNELNGISDRVDGVANPSLLTLKDKS